MIHINVGGYISYVIMFAFTLDELICLDDMPRVSVNRQLVADTTPVALFLICHFIKVQLS